MAYNFPGGNGGGGGGGGGSYNPRLINSTAGLNVHASSFQQQQQQQQSAATTSSMMIGISGAHLGGSLLHPPQRPHSRKYDSEPLHGRDRYGNQSTIHSPSYLSTSSASQSTTRTQSRTSSVASSLLPSPRAASPLTPQNYHAVVQAQQQQQQQQPLPGLLPSTPGTQSPAVSISPPLASAPRTLHQTPALIVTPPGGNAAHCRCGSAPVAVTSPSASTTSSSCTGCADLRQENAHLRAQVAACNYDLQGVKSSTKAELQKMRSDVTKALVAFESRLHLQLQQQLGFKPDLEPMQAVTGAPQPTSSIVSQALTQIQQQLDKFEARSLGQQQQQQQQKESPTGSPWHTNPSSKRTSWNPGPGVAAPLAVMNAQAAMANNQSGGGWHEQSASNSSLSPPQMTSALLTGSGHHSLLAPTAGNSSNQSPSHSQQQQQQQNLLSSLNLGNINLASLSHLLNAVSGLQNQLGGGGAGGAQTITPSHLQSLLHAPQPTTHNVHHHHHSPSPQGGGMTEERLILLAIDILSVHGAVPVGKMGSLLHKAANDHTLPQMLKERYGGLKKFLQSQTQFFQLGTDHPYNPLLSLAPEFLAANPHIRPPEPQLPTTTMTTEAALPPALGSQDPGLTVNYHQYFGANGTAGGTGGSSLLTPLPGMTTPSVLQREYSHPTNDAALDDADDAYLFEADSLSDRARQVGDAGRATAFLAGNTANVQQSQQQQQPSSTAPVSAQLSPLSASDATSVDSAAQVLNGSSRASSGHPSISSPSDAVVGWETLSSPLSASSSATATATIGVAPGSERGRDAERSEEDAPLHIDNSPSLGATEASASANATFFSRLLS